MADRQTYPPSLADIERLAQHALANLPRQFRDWLGDVLLRVEDFPDETVMAEIGLESPFDILGLYQGRPVGEKSVELSGTLPDVIHLYRRPILDEWADSGESLEALVTHVLVHEVGHHFGFSDEDMERIEAQIG